MINRIIKFSLVSVFFLFFLLSCDWVTEPESIDDPTDFPSYELIWSDEFDQESLTPDPAKWGYDLGYGGEGWGNDEWQLYTDSQENVRVENGNLIITALWDSTNFSVPGKRDGSVTSARVNTKEKFSAKFGKIQARIKPPTSMGMWPAFWMLGTNYDTSGWPYCGEIDIMEMSPLYHNDRTTLFTLHWWDDAEQIHRYYGTSKQLSAPLSDDFHIFEAEWDEQRIVGKIDGITYFVKVIEPGTMNEFLREFFLLLNVAVGGNLGGTPDDTTEWPQQMHVDWVRVYQAAGDQQQIETFGIFTDETPVDAGLTIGVDAEIYVFESTLTGGSTPPYEGENVISWSTTGQGWFGGGIKSNLPIDLSDFAAGTINFMIKIPANVTFKIGINDTEGHENYVEFPAGQTTYGLVRDGEWGQAIIPVEDIRGNIDLEMMNYEFIILEENGMQCQLALDDIYWAGGGMTVSSVSFDSETYSFDETLAYVSVIDEAAANSTVTVDIDNGTENISLDVILDGNGYGTGTLNFGATDDDTDTIEITAGDIITATYTDSNGNIRTDTAAIQGGSEPGAIGIFSESHTEQMLTYEQIINSADWSGNSAAPDELSTGVTPVDGTYVLAVEFTDLGAGWGGISFFFGSAGQDISSMTSLILNVDSSQMSGLTQLGVKLEDSTGGNTEVNLSSYTPVISGNWARYEIPLSHFNAVDLTALIYLGLWNPRDTNNNLLFGTLYFDDIYLSGEISPPPGEAAGIYSESHIETMIPYQAIINSADWGGNSAVPDLENSDVTPLDGNYVMAVDFQAGGATYCGVSFDFGSVDISGYETLVFSIDTSVMTDLVHFGIKLEDSSAGNNEINISSLTPVINGNWATYEIPLSQYPAVNLSDLKYLGLWNPRDNAENLLIGTLYFDDIHLISR